MKTARGLSLAAVALAAALGGWYGKALLDSKGKPREAESRPSVAETGPCPGGAQPAYWKAPMDPTFVRDAPGKSPMGMDLVPVCPDAGAGEGGGVRIDPVLVQNMGVREALVERRDIARTIRAVGRVAYDERLVAHVHTKVQGWVERLFVDYEGQMVDRGEPLLEIYSPELLATQEELLMAARYRDETARSSAAEVRESGSRLFDATERRLELWDIPERDVRRLLETGKVRKNLTLYSPATGVVTHMMVREGMEVGSSDNLYTIADLARVWVYADLYEYELPWVAVGQKAAVELSYLPDETFVGEVSYVYPFLDPETRTARVRIEIENSDLLLKPEMFANVRIEADLREQVLVVPDEAAMRSGSRTLVVVARGEGRFEPREVALGVDSGDGWLEVREGLAEGDRVVTSGQFLIDSESRMREAFQKLLDRSDAGTAASAEGGE